MQTRSDRIRFVRSYGITIVAGLLVGGASDSPEVTESPEASGGHGD